MSEKSNSAAAVADDPGQKEMLPGVPRRRPARKADPDPVLVPDLRKPGQLKPLARTKKSNEFEMQQRRRDVRRLRMRGMSYNEIAQALNISIFTVKRDLDVIQKEAVARIDEVEQKQFVGEVLLTFDEVERHAWDEFYKSDPGSKQRISALDVVRTTANDKLKVATEVGLIQRAAQEIKHTHQALPWDDQTKQAAIQALLQSKLSPQFMLPTPDTEHVPGKNIEVRPVIDAQTIEPAASSGVVVDIEPSTDGVPSNVSPPMREMAAEAIRRLVGLGMSQEEATRAIAEGSAMAEVSGKDIAKKVLNKPKA